MNGKLYIERNKFLIILLWFIMTIVCIGQLSGILSMPSNIGVTIESTIVFLIINLYFAVDKKLQIFGFTHAHLLYASISAFCVGWVCYFVSRDSVYKTLSSYSSRFLDSPMYAKAIILSMLAFLIYIFGAEVGRTLSMNKNADSEMAEVRNRAESRVLANIGIIFIGLSFVAFAIFILLGRVSLSMNYTQFRNAMESFSLYKYMLFLYEVGICFVVACGNTEQLRFGVILYIAVATVFFLTGNKGEVLYGLLACIAILRYKGVKIKLKYVLWLAVLVFLIIPFVTAARSEGVLESLSSIGINFTGFFVELGTQVRCTVYVLEQVFSGSRQLIWGYSYYNPIVNIFNRIIPFVDISIQAPASFDFKTAFLSMGFNQIAEGYANFGAIGSCLYFFITGAFLSKNEGKIMSDAELGYIGAVCAILINVSRNKFAFFWGQVLIVSLLYMIVSKIIVRSNDGLAYGKVKAIRNEVKDER